MQILIDNSLKMSKVNSEGNSIIHNQVSYSFPVTAPFYNLISQINLAKFSMLANTAAQKKYLSKM